MGRFTTRKAYRKLKRESLKYGAVPKTPIKKLRRITQHYREKSGVPIYVSEKGFTKKDITDACVYIPPKGSKRKPRVYIHPITQFYNKKEIEGTIEHELEHIKIAKSGEEKHQQAHDKRALAQFRERGGKEYQFRRGVKVRGYRQHRKSKVVGVRRHVRSFPRR